MKKSVKIGFPIFCVVIVGGTLIALSHLQNKADEISNNKNENKIVNSINQTDENNNITINNSINNENDYTSIDEENSTITNQVANNTNTEKINMNKENESIENTTLNTTNNSNTVNTTNTVNTSNNKNSVAKTEETEEKNDISDKDKAISMVQAEWGSDSSVYFTNEGVSDGCYIVAVRDKSNTSVKLFYKVNLKENTVEIDW